MWYAYDPASTDRKRTPGFLLRLNVFGLRSDSFVHKQKKASQSKRAVYQLFTKKKERAVEVPFVMMRGSPSNSRQYIYLLVDCDNLTQTCMITYDVVMLSCRKNANICAQRDEKLISTPVPLASISV